MPFRRHSLNVAFDLPRRWDWIPTTRVLRARWVEWVWPSTPARLRSPLRHRHASRGHGSHHQRCGFHHDGHVRGRGREVRPDTGKDSRTPQNDIIKEVPRGAGFADLTPW